MFQLPWNWLDNAHRALKTGSEFSGCWLVSSVNDTTWLCHLWWCDFISIVANILANRKKAILFLLFFFFLTQLNYHILNKNSRVKSQAQSQLELQLICSLTACGLKQLYQNDHTQNVYLWQLYFFYLRCRYHNNSQFKGDMPQTDFLQFKYLLKFLSNIYPLCYVWTPPYDAWWYDSMVLAFKALAYCLSTILES